MENKKRIEKAVRCAKRAAPAGVAGTVTGGPFYGFINVARDFVTCIAERDREVTRVDRVTCMKLGGEPTPDGKCMLLDGEKKYLAYLKPA
ncbi:MAG: hypothetical protein E3J91_01455 [Hadesarchaea archaeon]|nr:MAG: hypothetical protein E3J91_01455 [Hadesarchaea archaeon]